MKTRPLSVVALLGAGAIALAVWYARLPETDLLPRVELTAGKGTGPGMCPWRNPARDIARFFPEAGPNAKYRTDTLVISSIRRKILDRLGSGGKIESNSLYVYRVGPGPKAVGSFLVRRAAGPRGAIEVVVGIRPNGRIAGVAIQRQREPEDAARFITSRRWLGAFSGKTASGEFRSGRDLPAAPPEAREAAEAVAAAVRTVAIELEEAENHYADAIPAHH